MGHSDWHEPQADSDGATASDRDVTVAALERAALERVRASQRTRVALRGPYYHSYGRCASPVRQSIVDPPGGQFSNFS